MRQQEELSGRSVTAAGSGQSPRHLAEEAVGATV